MASLRKIRTKTGEGWRIEIVLNGDRESIYLGKTNKKAVETIQSRVETVDSCNKAGIQYPPDVAQWLRAIADDLHEKLSKVGLVEARKKACQDCGAKSVTAHAGNTSQISELQNKKAVNCSVLQLTALPCEPPDSRGGTRSKFHNPV